MSNARLYWVISLITCATLILELSITRLFSVLMYYHFAFMAISIALFGLGAAGLYLFIFEKFFSRRRLEKLLSLCCLLFIVSVIIALSFVVRLPIKPDYSIENIYRLIIIYVVSVVPFFFSGLAVSAILFYKSKDISRLYFFDLVGAALGALLTIPLLNWVGAINTQLFALLLASIAAMLTVLKIKSILRTISYLMPVLVAVLLFTNDSLHLFELQFLKGTARQDITFEKWNSFSHISVKRLPKQPNVMAIDIDADARTYVLQDPFRTMGAATIRDDLAPRWASSLPNALIDSGKVLIIGPGGGMDVVFALAFGAAHVEGVEINPIIVNDVMKGELRSFSGNIYERANVDIHVAEGRSYVSHSDKLYDMIQLTLVDTWAATSAGAFSLSENNLYTVEAFESYLSHLKPDGILAFTRWLFPQPRQTLRLMTTAFAAAKNLGISEPERHVTVAAVKVIGTNMEMATFIFKMTPLNRQEIEVFSERAALGNGRIVYSPFDAVDNAFTRYAASHDRDKFIDDYKFNISPTSDNKPFFFNTVRGLELGEIMRLEQESRKNNLGVFSLLVVAVASVLMVLLFLLVPMFFLKTGRRLLRTSGGVKSLLYFVAIGLGFILLEIALMQRFVLYLGHPVYSLAVVLTCLLVTAGAGSFYTKRFDFRSSRRYGIWLFLAIVITTALEIVLLPILFEATFSFSIASRIAISFVALAPLGFLLGQPFPLELKYLEHRFREIIPWAWGLNGAASVLGSVAAIALAMVSGFTVVLTVGLLCYVAAFLARGWKTA